MDKAKVYFTDFRVPVGRNIMQKLRALCLAAGIKKIDMDGKFVAIKMHFGELGNMAYLRPQYAKVVADLVKEQGGMPFLTDCNTLYPGSRKHALEHMDCANFNGFNTVTTGCQIIIGDGIRGTDEALVPLTGTKLVTEAKIGRAIMDADVFISLSHFKGHEQAGFGGAIKNIGMGCASRAGKMEQHCDGKPEVNPKRCRGCRACARECAHNAISFDADGKANIDRKACVGCGRCIGACCFDAIRNRTGTKSTRLLTRMAEYTYAVLKDRPHFHVSIVMQVSPFCDCHAENDTPIIPDVGMFASFDPVALDVACADACNRQPVIAGSYLDEQIHGGHDHHDHFTSTFPTTDWRFCMEYAEQLGIGTRSYELITV